VAARGIDVESLSHIINYDVPVEKESYVHRIGRTGRAGSSGKAITFADPREYRILAEIEEYIGYKIPRGEEPYKEEVDRAKKAFDEKNNRKPELKADKGTNLNKQITKLYIGAGKKKKLRAGDVCKTITSHMKLDCHMYIHPNQARGLSPREAARLRTFPDDYFFRGSLNDWYQQIGNAVPVKLAEIIAKEIRNYYK
jgi:superfamily II DNA/RNA helicase